MKTVWLIEFTAEAPPVYIAEEGGLTYQATKARQYGSKAEAEKRMQELGLSISWEVVSHDL
jgi:hypothetical protein